MAPGLLFELEGHVLDARILDPAFLSGYTRTDFRLAENLAKDGVFRDVSKSAGDVNGNSS